MKVHSKGFAAQKKQLKLCKRWIKMFSQRKKYWSCIAIIKTTPIVVCGVHTNTIKFTTFAITYFTGFFCPSAERQQIYKCIVFYVLKRIKLETQGKDHLWLKVLLWNVYWRLWREKIGKITGLHSSFIYLVLTLPAANPINKGFHQQRHTSDD